MSLPNRERDRQAAIAQAHVELARDPVYLDTETTGLGLQDEIIEICILESDGSVLFESLVKPRGSISEGAYWAHRITQRMLKDAPSWRQIAPTLRLLLAGRRIAAYNAAFDLRMIRQCNAQHDLRWELDESAFLCVMKLYARFYGKWDPARGEYRWHGLARAARQCGIEPAKSHRAREDARLGRAVLQHIASHYVVPIAEARPPSHTSLLQKWFAWLHRSQSHSPTNEPAA